MTGLLFRTAQPSDLNAIHQLATESGIGITTLSKNIDVLEKRLKLSVESINKSIVHPKHEYYLFVLEDPRNQTLVGTSAIEASTGNDAHFYSYKLSKKTYTSSELGLSNDVFTLELVNENHGKSELCTLYLKPEYRHSYHGIFLSRARFLFMAEHPARFELNVIAEMRGVADDDGNSPFWSSVGEHFFKMPFNRADELTLSTNKKFITDLLPQTPILVQLLDKNVQEIIGKPHQASQGAMHILINEGFSYGNHVDIFDAGPTVEATRHDIHTIKTSQRAMISDIIDDVSGPRCIVANTQVAIRATVAHILLQNERAIITNEAANLLQLKKGDAIRVSILKEQS